MTADIMPAVPALCPSPVWWRNHAVLEIVGASLSWNLQALLERVFVVCEAVPSLGLCTILATSHAGQKTLLTTSKEKERALPSLPLLHTDFPSPDCTAPWPALDVSTSGLQEPAVPPPWVPSRFPLFPQLARHSSAMGPLHQLLPVVCWVASLPLSCLLQPLRPSRRPSML